jgi:Tetratricopeptide repeat
MLSRYVKAKPYFQEAVNVRTGALGETHPEVLASQFKIGLIQLAGDPELALSTFNGIVVQLGDCPTSYGFLNEAKILNGIAVAQFELGRTVEAFSGFFKAFKILLKSHSAPAQRALASTLCNLGYVYAGQKQYSDALFAFNESIAILKKHNRMNDSLAATLEENIAYVKAYGGNLLEDLSPRQESVQVIDKEREGHRQSHVFASCVPQTRIGGVPDEVQTPTQSKMLDVVRAEDDEITHVAQSRVWGGCMAPREQFRSAPTQSSIRGSCAKPDGTRVGKVTRAQSRLSACFVLPGPDDID